MVTKSEYAELEKKYKTSLKRIEDVGEFAADIFRQLEIRDKELKILVTQQKNNLQDSIEYANQTNEKICKVVEEANDILNAVKSKHEDAVDTLEFFEKLSEKNKHYDNHIEIYLKKIELASSDVEKTLNKAVTLSLAENFEKRRSAAEANIKKWGGFLTGFIGIIGAILLLLFLNHSVLSENIFWETVIFSLRALTFTAPVIWVATICAKNLHSSIRLEEFYAEKAVLASTYIGYRKEIETLTGIDEDYQGLLVLMQQNLAMLAKSSEHIFSKETEDIIYKKGVNMIVEKIDGKSDKPTSKSKKEKNKDEDDTIEI